MTENVAAVVVSYNVRELLVACVASLQSSGDVAQIIVVDNASSDGSADAVRELFPDVTVVEAANRGYGIGANIGIAASDTPCVLVLNPDTTVPAGAIAEMATVMRDNPRLGMLGPRLHYPDGQLQPTRRRFPTPLTPLFESTILERFFPDNRWRRRFHMRDVAPKAGLELVDWVVGAALMIRRAAFDEAGGFDEDFFMYSEEVDLAWRMNSRGWRVGYLPTAEFTHHESASAGQNTVRRQTMFDSSRVLLTRRMYGPIWAEVVRAGLLLGYILQLLIETTNWVLRRTPLERRRRMALYLRALASGLRQVRA